MPELPEVETTVRGLRSRVVGQAITSFWCDWPAMIRYISPTQFAKQVKGTRIIGVNRRGKNIIIDLNNRLSIVAHMKMTGHFLHGTYRKVQSSKVKGQNWEAIEEGPLKNDPYNRFVHVVFELKNGKHIAFSDMRKFGKMALHETKNLHTSKELGDLGPELWEIDAKKFVEIYRNKKSGKIKQVLLDQTLLAGVGNIYSDEGLWLAGIHPLSQPSQIPVSKLGELYRGLIKVTKASLKTGGDSMSDYRNVEGLGGKFQNFHKAYKQTGKICCKKNCSGMMKRMVVGARSSHFCPKHQTLYV
ncbi:MAG: DNA-formamidopyrimidine glycosylase [Candidatus Yanofskybacteria bacterium RIFCSPLOWO2_02_FULL_47_9b]|uniref:DNA-formamidopyrimidine glycosylase n=1 Tax=Candidatus Yanofskybacteria bacterium RIFCSPLOWO2_02_FULL_47_9b TaxID=1802708 RepID=A0A1F8H8M0_9BACT|nr:MAG: DNA-formamidopyrimidine glycosylase [Candidatus Yanofskybacteria bacterium RIFCSPLOWO2_02_FULL_47_9b]